MNQIGHKIILLDSTDSTNNYIANLVKSNKLAHGTAIIADEQTKGRGQRGTEWTSQPGMNLMMSVYVEHDSLAVDSQASIHNWVAVSVWNVMDKMGVKTTIKWPNDILTESGKLSGILIENSLIGKQVKSSIIGIGLNVNQTDFSSIRATSIYLETGLTFRIEEIAIRLLNELNTQFIQLQHQNFEALKASYHSKMWGMNRQVEFYRNGKMEVGTITGTNQIGAIEVQTMNGVEYFDLKQVEFVIE